MVAFNARFWSKVFPGITVRRAEARDRAAVSPGEGAEPHPAGPPTEGAPGRPGRRNAAHHSSDLRHEDQKCEVDLIDLIDLIDLLRNSLSRP